jgi:probable F420-dependent oxidoreductase
LALIGDGISELDHVFEFPGPVSSPIMAMTSNRPLRVAVQVAPQHGDYAAIRRAATAAEDLGADVVFNWDHFFPLGKVRDGKHFECWTMLGAWAESTSRAQIGALVSCVGYRDADLLARMARTVDQISGGRLVLGLGAGFREWEFEQYGYDFGTPAQRVQDVAVALRRLSALDTPLLLAAGGPKMLRLTAQHAGIWHSLAKEHEVGDRSRLLDQYCRELGRDPAEIERSAFVSGDPREVGPRYREHGITLFTVLTSGPDFDLGELRSWITWRDEQNRHAAAAALAG